MQRALMSAGVRGALHCCVPWCAAVWADEAAALKLGGVAATGAGVAVQRRRRRCGGAEATAQRLMSMPRPQLWQWR